MDLILVKNIELKLNTLKYTRKEVEHIVDLVNKDQGTVFDWGRFKFRKKCSFSQYGIPLRTWYEDVVQ